MKASAKKVIHPLDAIYDEHSRVLILGSFPSVISRQNKMYYANKTNRFWAVMEALFNVEITDHALFCHQHHIAMWDVIHSCTIEGSSDSSIKNVKTNDIAGLVHKSNIQLIVTTGKKAAVLYNQYIHLDIPHISLPSTSAANAKMRLEQLVNEYQKIKGVL
ncbi:DNA-deoxyinosine glycosylase [Solobacterium sp.]|uniref:DNA-deoxyinosine glycosylase n=1 Tax=Solobacterium sp. TaxID=2060878 RepID=UPI001CAB4372|nr:DNA-deoxyinosine glycosylase [Solobacterium sp.]MBF1085791.1 DNA-deoxyinosine glycosylase [Solobacterium sp.]MBF1115964.1 DNA-deoxyinosine glycosylase [Solobacterium sp.]